METEQKNLSSNKKAAQGRFTRNAEALGSEKIGKLLLRLSLPATAGMISMSLYNLVDTIFVGRGVGTLAIGGLSIVMPIQMLIFASTQTLGIGGSSVVSRKLGARDHKQADRSFGNLISLTLLLSIGLLIVGYAFSDTILFLFGSAGDIKSYAKDYYLIILAGTPFLSYAMVLNTIIRAEGNARTAMLTMMVAAVINIILDPIFIFVLHMGVKGAALASVIAQFCTFLYIGYYFSRGKSALHFSVRHLKLNMPIVREILAIGASSLGRHGAGSILAAILNHALFAYGGAISVAAYGVINRVLRVVFMPMMGLVQGYLPIAGFNFGSKDFHRVKEVSNIALKWASVIAVGLYILLMVFARQVMAIFTQDQQLIQTGQYALRVIILMMPILSFQLIGASYFQAAGKALPSFILALSRQILLLLPLLLILPVFWGLNGIWFAFPISDTLATFITLGFLIPEVRWMERKIKAMHIGPISPDYTRDSL